MVCARIYSSFFKFSCRRLLLVNKTGLKIEDVGSKYFEYYFFADYLSNELFSYEFKTDKLTIYPLNNVGGYITSLAINPYLSDSILITTTSGNLLQINLP